jgi:hypothetical protein
MFRVTLARKKFADCKSLQECSIAVRKFIDDNMLGASAFYGGRVAVNGKTVAWVSYNGRLWKPDRETPIE